MAYTIGSPARAIFTVDSYMTTCRHPQWQFVLNWTGIDLFLAMLWVNWPCQSILVFSLTNWSMSNFSSKSFIVFQVIAKQREGLGEWTTPSHNLRTAIWQGIDGSILLEQTNRIHTRENADCTSQTNLLGINSTSCKDNSGADTANPLRWCSPIPSISKPTLSASSISATNWRMRSSWL